MLVRDVLLKSQLLSSLYTTTRVLDFYRITDHCNIGSRTPSRCVMSEQTVNIFSYRVC